LFSAQVDEKENQIRLFNLAWQAWLEAQNFTALQEEIGNYNRYFPIEANLPTDPETGELVWLGRPWRGLTAPDVEAVLERHPLR
jgi:hypothetical protein